MGSSGSGKSTLLNIIGALDGDYRGQAHIAGRDLRTLDDNARSAFRNRTVGYVFQQFHLLPHLPVGDNVAMPAWFAGAPKARRQDILDALDRVGLAHKIDATPNHLSGGERQRVAIARALFNKPRLLLCDEPTGALDTATGDRIMELFTGLHRDAGITMLMVTHEPDVAARCQRTVHVRDGRIVDAAGHPADGHAADASAPSAPPEPSTHAPAAPVASEVTR